MFVVLGELHRPAVFERPEIRLGRFERRAGFPVAIVDRHLDGGAVLLDQKIARVEDHEVELFHDEPQALERLFLAAAGGCRSTGMWIT
ncbi:MAG TPA: hypothetical protein VI038_05040 [Methyloceanibacter sp.]